VTGRFHPYAPSIDRINPKRGYTPDNVRLVVFAINTMLLDWGPTVLERVASAYAYRKNKTRKSMVNLLGPGLPMEIETSNGS
jgi:hypothetical protein